MDIKKIDSVTFPVKDYAKSASWYADKLGLAEIWRMDERKGVGFGVGDNSATINLFQEDGAPQLIIQVERVDDARTELERRGVGFEGPTTTITARLLRRARSAHAKQMSAARLREYTIEHGESSG
jgi:catechol 2,3-dioxygenase-like lactoylglutathione lyase family enzyme